ncbi:MAG TPA: HAD family hydrolase [Vicinamibacterales bacterium]
MQPTVSALVVDLDHTLFDWTSAWMAAYSYAIDATCAAMRIDRAQLEPEIQAEHRRRQTSEFLTDWRVFPCLARAEAELAGPLDDIWRRAQRLYDLAPPYPGVELVLDHALGSGAPVIVCTEAPERAARRRLHTLGLEEYVTALCCAGGELEAAPPRRPLRIVTRHRKPQPEVLLDSLAAVNVPPADAVYIGDHEKDLAMGLAAGTRVVWARYGTARSAQALALLHRLCHWDPTHDETRTPPPPVAVPALERSFVELLPLVAFRGAHPRVLTARA